MKKIIGLVAVFAIVLVGCSNQQTLTTDEFYTETQNAWNSIQTSTQEAINTLNAQPTVEQAQQAVDTAYASVMDTINGFSQLTVDAAVEPLKMAVQTAFESIASLLEQTQTILASATEMPADLVNQLTSSITEVFNNLTQVSTELATSATSDVLSAFNTALNGAIDQANSLIPGLDIPNVQ